jgi:hypothetical protein
MVQSTRHCSLPGSGLLVHALLEFLLIIEPRDNRVSVEDTAFKRIDGLASLAT